MMKLIINADDFGLTLGVSKGILEGMRHGVITDTSAITAAPDFMRSAALAMEQGVRVMGIHCLLTMGHPLLPAEQVPSLLNEEGCFYSRADFFKADVKINEARAELEAQIKRFLSTGLQLNHIDTHHGFMNKSKEMAALLLELSQKYQVPLRNEALRLPQEKRLCDVSLTSLPTTEALYFNHGIPYHTLDTMLAFLQEALACYDCVEIGCHPGYSDDQLRLLSVLNDDREKELDLLLSPQLKGFIHANKISLISYTAL